MQCSVENVSSVFVDRSAAVRLRPGRGPCEPATTTTAARLLLQLSASSPRVPASVCNGLLMSTTSSLLILDLWGVCLSEVWRKNNIHSPHRTEQEHLQFVHTHYFVISIHVVVSSVRLQCRHHGVPLTNLATLPKSSNCSVRGHPAMVIGNFISSK